MHKGKALDGEECLSQASLGESCHELTLTCDSVGCYLGPVFQSGPSVTSKPLRASWPQKMDAKAAGSWSGLPELSTATLCCLQDVHLKQKDTGSSKAKGQKKLYYSNTNQKKSGKLHEYLTR